MIGKHIYMIYIHLDIKRLADSKPELFINYHSKWDLFEFIKDIVFKKINKNSIDPFLFYTQ